MSPFSFIFTKYGKLNFLAYKSFQAFRHIFYAITLLKNNYDFEHKFKMQILIKLLFSTRNVCCIAIPKRCNIKFNLLYESAQTIARLSVSRVRKGAIYICMDVYQQDACACKFKRRIASSKHTICTNGHGESQYIASERVRNEMHMEFL